MANKRGEIRVYGVPKTIATDLKKICKANQTTVSDFLKPKLREIVEENKHILKFEDEK